VAAAVAVVAAPAFPTAAIKARENTELGPPSSS
jgi:hypothetical protein